MKKSELTSFIKEEIKSTLSKTTTIESDVKKYVEMLDELKEKFPSGKVKAKASALIGDLLDYINMNEDTQQDIKDTEELTKAVADLAKAKEEAGLAEQEEDDDENKMHKDALKGAKAARGKSKKLDTAITALSSIKKEMVSIVNQWKKSEGEEKEKLQSDLKKKTTIKKELEALIKKLEKDVV